MKRTSALPKLCLRLSFFTLFMAVLGAGTSSFASPIETPPWAWRKGSFGISSTTEYFSSKANYDTVRGQYTHLTGDNSFTDFNTWLRGRYAFWPFFESS